MTMERKFLLLSMPHCYKQQNPVCDNNLSKYNQIVGDNNINYLMILLGGKVWLDCVRCQVVFSYVIRHIVSGGMWLYQVTLGMGGKVSVGWLCIGMLGICGKVSSGTTLCQWHLI